METWKLLPQLLFLDHFLFLFRFLDLQVHGYLFLSPPNHPFSIHHVQYASTRTRTEAGQLWPLHHTACKASNTGHEVLYIGYFTVSVFKARSSTKKTTQIKIELKYEEDYCRNYKIKVISLSFYAVDILLFITHLNFRKYLFLLFSWHENQLQWCAWNVRTCPMVAPLSTVIIKTILS